MESHDVKDQDLQPTVIFMKMYAEGFFCPTCNTPLTRAKNLIFSVRSQEYWKCLECHQQMRLIEEGHTLHFELLKEIPEEKIISGLPSEVSVRNPFLNNI